jgi:hypothetical protein
MKKKHHGMKGHTGHHQEIAKAHGHVADMKPKANKAFDSEIYPGSVGHDQMAHPMHHAANAHHGMHDGMSPDGEHGTVPTSGSHLGNNESHDDDYAASEGSGESERGEKHYSEDEINEG